MPARRYSSRPASRIVQGQSTARRVIEQSRLRLYCTSTFFGLAFLTLALRLVEVSLMGSADIPFKRLVSEPELLVIAQDDAEEPKATFVSESPRRLIVDRNGIPLAMNIKTAALVANPKLIRDPQFVAQRLAHILPDATQKDILDKLQKDTRFIYVERHLSPHMQKEINALGVPGLFFEPSYRRIYPYEGMLAHVLGYVNVDNHGIAGIEKEFDKALSDGFQSSKPLALSIDLRLQHILYEELSNTVSTFKAIAGTGIIYDLEKGEVLAMVSLPDFDPHRPAEADANERFNRATLGVYEMGSVFKSFTMAMGFQHRIVNMQDGYDISDPIRVGGFTIADYHPMKGWHSIPEIFAESSNIGTVKLAMDVGQERQRHFLSGLGMMEPVALELPERAHPLLPQTWRDVSSMTISYGHGISVTPMHVVQGMGRILSSGNVYPPTLLKDGNAKQAPLKPLVNEETSRNMRNLLRMVVRYGTAKKADVPGYRVGGKTGTSEKIKNGRYSSQARLSSFVGTFPIDKPRYLLLAMVDEPIGNQATAGYATGGWVAAPLVAHVIERMGPMLGIRPVFEIPEPPREEERWAWKKHNGLQQEAVYAVAR